MINWRLWLGLILVAFLCFIAVFGPDLAPYSENYSKSFEFLKTAHGTEYMTAPYPPSSKYWLGTTNAGNDILSLLMYGAKYTIFTAIIVALARIVIGGFFGLWSGVSKYSEREHVSFGALGSFPAFLIVYFVMMGITLNTPLTKLEHTLILGTIMALVGIPGIYSIIQAKTAELNKKQYVEASVTLGGSKLHLVWKHIIPHLKGNFIILFVHEIILSIGLLGQLGIFHIFLGGTMFHPQGITEEDKFTSITHEWVGMVGHFREYVFGYQWILFYPLCAVAFAILSFYLLSRGLEKKQKDSFQKVPYI